MAITLIAGADEHRKSGHINPAQVALQVLGLVVYPTLAWSFLPGSQVCAGLVGVGLYVACLFSFGVLGWVVTEYERVSAKRSPLDVRDCLLVVPLAGAVYFLVAHIAAYQGATDLMDIANCRRSWNLSTSDDETERANTMYCKRLERIHDSDLDGLSTDRAFRVAYWGSFCWAAVYHGICSYCFPHRCARTCSLSIRMIWIFGFCYAALSFLSEVFGYTGANSRRYYFGTFLLWPHTFSFCFSVLLILHPADSQPQYRVLGCLLFIAALLYFTLPQLLGCAVVLILVLVVIAVSLDEWFQLSRHCVVNRSLLSKIESSEKLDIRLRREQSRSVELQGKVRDLEKALGKVKGDLHLTLQWFAEARGGELRMMRPQDIKFSHSTISCCFRSGTSVDDAITAIHDGTKSVNEFPPIHCTDFNGECFAVVGNRRLFMLRVLETLRDVDRVPVVHFGFRSQEIQHRRDGKTKWERSYTTRNGGLSVGPTRCGVCGNYRSSVWKQKQ